MTNSFSSNSNLPKRPRSPAFDNDNDNDSSASEPNQKRPYVQVPHSSPIQNTYKNGLKNLDSSSPIKFNDALPPTRNIENRNPNRISNFSPFLEQFAYKGDANKSSSTSLTSNLSINLPNPFKSSFSNNLNGSIKNGSIKNGSLQQTIQMLKLKFDVKENLIIALLKKNNGNLRETTASLNSFIAKHPEHRLRTINSGFSNNNSLPSFLSNPSPSLSPKQRSRPSFSSDSTAHLVSKAKANSNITKPSLKITEKYNLKNNNNGNTSNNEIRKRKKKLVRGSKFDNEVNNKVNNDDNNVNNVDNSLEAISPSKFYSNSKLAKSKKKIVNLSEEEEDQFSEPENTQSDQELDDDEKYENKEESQDNYQIRILEFLNTAPLLDISDIGSCSPEIAQLLIDERPYESLEQIEEKDFVEIDNAKVDMAKKTKRTYLKRKTMGLRIVEKTEITLKGYDAIETLIEKCSKLGQTISKDIASWGVDRNGKVIDKKLYKQNKIGLSLVNVQKKIHDDDEEDHDGDNDLTITKETELNEKELKNSEKISFVKEVELETGLDIEKVESESDISDGEEYSDDEDDEDEDENISFRKSRNNRRSRNNGTSVIINQNKKYISEQPQLLSDTLELKIYQQFGFNWLNLLYSYNLSCILADEMGLGKTVQVISFLTYLKQIDPKNSGQNLIIVPASTLENWLREFQKFSPELQVSPYYGTQNERIDLRIHLSKIKYDILITTYSLACGSKEDQKFLIKQGFNCIIYDEGHMLKNSTSERYNKLMRLKGKFRILLTGTPLQNNLKELISLLSFILPGIFKEHKEDLQVLFNQKATTKSGKKRKGKKKTKNGSRNVNENENENEDGDEDSGSNDSEEYNPLLSIQAISKAKRIMEPFILRRRKKHVLKNLPKKIHQIEYCELLPAQKRIYEKEIDEGKSNQGINMIGNKTKTKNIIMNLRKAAIHPLLFRNIYTDSKLKQMSERIMKEEVYKNANRQFIYEDMEVMTDFELNELCEKFPKSLSRYKLKKKDFYSSDKVLKLKKYIREYTIKGSKMLIFSLFTQVLDIIEKFLEYEKVKFLRLDGSTAVDIRQDLIDKFYKEEEIKIFLLTTKSGGFGINLVCANVVIIFDQSFNPHDDKQAEDRCHRLGQEKDVEVIKLITKDSIEENILMLGRNKLALDKNMSENTKVIVELDDKKEMGKKGNQGDGDKDEDGDEEEEEYMDDNKIEEKATSLIAQILFKD
ncbi:DNA-dependent ATPase FUN30 ASCRUDRAFT_73458 [Ascoidea rubescens DSM 1968]|uniref:Uncharacterized protein n=1 Tax=Ascoidea rubescens DSM 1968 TaxID=1344418 RepID=A0A1D2VQ16_9ASCO|nr:hypothetical protein ASCRUDRAFT_73458 [Ascoidea rubescens DSM 1968]ODV63645.1 hypothetical protein ASCRUDRAFT_73458 [Ascoidea rubescens DSM 1968]